MNSRVNHPDYYNQGPIVHIDDLYHYKLECIDVIRDMPTWKGNAIKYLWRAGLKKEAEIADIDKEIEDLNKAMWYIQDRIDYLTFEKNSR